MNVILFRSFQSFRIWRAALMPYQQYMVWAGRTFLLFQCNHVGVSVAVCVSVCESTHTATKYSDDKIIVNAMIKYKYCFTGPMGILL